MKRIDKNNYYLDIAESALERSTCLRRKWGAVIVKDDEIISTGYNGAPRGRKNCNDIGTCIREELNVPRGERYELCRSVHAEQNAIISAAVRGVSIKGGTLYLNTYPCSICTRMLINAEIKRIVYDSDYNDPLSKEMLDESGIEVVRYKE